MNILHVGSGVGIVIPNYTVAPKPANICPTKANRKY